MKRAETAAASLMFPHLNSTINGLSIIPPPIPINPEKNPIIAPKMSPAGAGSTFGGPLRCALKKMMGEWKKKKKKKKAADKGRGNS